MDEREHSIVTCVINFFKNNLSEVYILGIADYTLEMSMEETQFEQPWVRWSLLSHHLAIVPLAINNC